MVKEITEKELYSLDYINCKLSVIKAMSSNFSFQEEFYGEDDLKPVLYLMTNGESIFILYNPFMTFLDGFDPFTGKLKNPSVSE